MNDTLKECPFCGSSWVQINRPANGSYPTVKCQSCNANGPGHAGITEAEAIAAWKARKSPRTDGLADELERLIEAFHDSLPQGQGETGDGGVAGKALCQFIYDRAPEICTALRTGEATDV